MLPKGGIVYGICRSPDSGSGPGSPSERLQPVPGRASGGPQGQLGEAIGFFLHSDGNPKLGSLVDAFAEELPVHVEALKTQLAACPAEEADRLAAQALELMLLYPRPKNGATEFSLAAFEGFAAPLLPFWPPPAGPSWRSATGRSPRPGRCCPTRRNSGRPCPAAEAQAQPPPRQRRGGG